jgi:hypothetical protein
VAGEVERVKAAIAKATRCFNADCELCQLGAIAAIKALGRNEDSERLAFVLKWGPPFNPSACCYAYGMLPFQTTAIAAIDSARRKR